MVPGRLENVSIEISITAFRANGAIRTAFNSAVANPPQRLFEGAPEGGTCKWGQLHGLQDPKASLESGKTQVVEHLIRTPLHFSSALEPSRLLMELCSGSLDDFLQKTELKRLLGREKMLEFRCILFLALQGIALLEMEIYVAAIHTGRHLPIALGSHRSHTATGREFLPEITERFDRTPVAGPPSPFE